MKRANIVKEAKITHLIVSALLFLSGIFLICRPELGAVIIRWLVGANLILCGIARVLGYFSNDLYRLAFQYDFAVGGLSVILGILFLICPEAVLITLLYVLGVYVILDGLLKLQTAFDAKTFGMKKWISLFVCAIVVVVSGVVVLVGSTAWNHTVLVGVALSVDGAENFFNSMSTVRIRAKKKGRFEELL